MSFLVFDGERKLAEIVARGYGELKASDRKRAEAAILRANPHLKTIKDVVPGSVIVLPAIPGIDGRSGRRSEVPAGDALAEVAGVLEDYRKRLAKAADAEHTELTDLRALLRSRPLRARLSKVEGANAYAERVAATLPDREAEHEERQVFLKALSAARKEFAHLAERVG